MAKTEKRYLASWCIKGWGPNDEEPEYGCEPFQTLESAQECTEMCALRLQEEWGRVDYQERTKNTDWQDVQSWSMVGFGVWEELTEC